MYSLLNSKPLFLLLLLFYFSQNIYSQTPVIEWYKTFGGRNGEYAHSVELTYDGGYITAGYTEGADNGDIMGYHGNELIQDIWVVKVNASGEKEWQKCLGGESFETGAYIRQTTDGGYLVAGTTASADCNIKSTRSADFWIIKLNSVGDIQWQKTYGGTKNEYAYGISIGNDGSCFIAGSSESDDGDVGVNKGDYDFWVIKLDKNGSLEWQKSMGSSGEDMAFAVEATSDGGCITTGYVSSNNGDVTNNHGTRDIWVVKLGNTGSINWQKCYGGSGMERGWAIKPVAGGYVIAGETVSNDGDVSGNHTYGSDFWLVKIDIAGNILWQKCYGGNKNEIAYALDITPDGGYIVAGSAESDDGDLNCNGGITDVWVIKVNSTGILEWQKNVGGNLYEEAYAVKTVKAGEYIIAGITCSKEVTGYHPPQGGNGSCGDFLVIKLVTPAAVPSPVVSINPSSGKVCAGSTATFTATVLYGGTNLSYRWERNGISVGGNQSFYTASDWKNNDQLKCYVTSGGSCEINTQQVSNTISIKVNDSGTPQNINIVANNTVVCDCDPIVFKASVTGSSESPQFQWQINGINKDNNSNTFTSASFQNGDEVRCIYTDNSTCIANGAVESNTIKLTIGTASPATVQVTAADTIICNETSVTFSAITQNAGNNPIYDWKLNGISTGTNSSTYTTTALKNNDQVSCTITVDPQFTCASSVYAGSNIIKITVNQKLPPSVEISTAKTSVCNGYPVTFAASAQNAGVNPSYQWQVNGVNAGNNNEKFISILNDNDAVTCIVTIDPLNACALSSVATSNTIKINIITATSPSIYIESSKLELCVGELIEFHSVVLNAGTSPTYTWKINDNITGTNAESFSTANLKSGDNVSCEIMPGVDAACSGMPVLSNILAPIVHDTLVVRIEPSDTLLISGSKIQLLPIVDGNIVSFQWSPANQLEDPLSFTPFTVSLSANQTYIITVKNEYQCESVASAIIKVFTELFMPNAFTPNNDQINDVFRIPPASSLNLKEFSVFDRWGNKVFSSTNILKGWDGRINGLLAPTGIYIYTIKGTDIHGEVNKRGIVTLLR